MIFTNGVLTQSFLQYSYQKQPQITPPTRNAKPRQPTPNKPERNLEIKEFKNSFLPRGRSQGNLSSNSGEQASMLKQSLNKDKYQCYGYAGPILSSSNNSRKDLDTSSEGCRVISCSDDEANILDSDNESPSFLGHQKGGRTKHSLIVSPSMMVRAEQPRFTQSNTEQSLPIRNLVIRDKSRMRALPEGSDNGSMLQGLLLKRDNLFQN